jgi:hypothetical protein
MNPAAGYGHKILLLKARQRTGGGGPRLKRAIGGSSFTLLARIISHSQLD